MWPIVVKTTLKVTGVILAMHAAILKGDSVFYIFSVKHCFVMMRSKKHRNKTIELLRRSR